MFLAVRGRYARPVLIALIIGALLVQPLGSGAILPPSPAFAQAAPAWSGIIDPSRAIDWSSTGVGAAIVNRTAQCGSTIAAYSGTAATINSAIATCNNGYVLLGPGTFTLSSTIDFGAYNNVTLRGSGPTQTIINFTGGNGCGANSGDICASNSTQYFVGSPIVQYGTGANTAYWTAGFIQGATQITLSPTSGLSVGMTLFLDQQDDSARDTGGVYVCQVPPCDTELPGGQGRSGRAQLEMKQIAAINGNVVTISPGLYNTNWRAAQNPGAWWVGPMLNGVGIENLAVNHASSTSARSGIYFYSCHNCWVRNIRSLNANRNHVWCYQSSNITVRDSYFYGTQNSATLSYGFEGYGCADALVENNIFQHVTSPVVLDNTTGMVDAYNFNIDDYYTVAAWMVAGHGDHAAGTAFNLFEGNQTTQFEADAVHGTHNQETVFRNWIAGLEPGKSEETVPIILYTFSRGINIIGNALGTPGYHTNYEDRYDLGTTANANRTIYVLGFCHNPNSLSSSTCVNTYQGNQTVYNDALTPTTLFRWGNYDTATATVRWVSSEVPTAATSYINGNPVPATLTLPASFYLMSKPAWWGSMPWPAIGPDVSGGTGPGGHAYAIPAAVCYNRTLRDSNGILLFDANACYQPPPISTLPTLVVTPTTLSLGSVAMGGVADSSLTVTNTGGGTLTGAASTAAPFSMISGGSFSLTGGVSQTVVVRFSPTATGTFTGSVNFTSNGGTASVAVTGTGTSSASPPAISVTPTAVNFGSVAIGGSSVNSLTITNTGGGTLTGTASTAVPFSVVSGGSFSLTGGASQTVVVQFSPTATGTFTGGVNFTSNTGATAVTVTGTGTASSAGGGGGGGSPPPSSGGGGGGGGGGSAPSSSGGGGGGGGGGSAPSSSGGGGGGGGGGSGWTGVPAVNNPSAPQVALVTNARTTRPVSWTDAVNVTVVGNSLRKTSGCRGCQDAGAISREQLIAGDGYVEFTASELGTRRFIGLTTGAPGTNPDMIRFAINLWPSGGADIREYGVYAAGTSYLPGDTFRIALEAGTVRYFKNSRLLYTSPLAPTYPLRVAASLLSLGATVRDAIISGTLSRESASPAGTTPRLDTSTARGGVLTDLVDVALVENFSQEISGCDGWQGACAYVVLPPWKEEEIAQRTPDGVTAGG